MFSTANYATPIHEFLHSANLPHSFSAYESNAYAKFTYQPKKTDNIMDYSHNLSTPIPRNSIWNWQGKVARDSSDVEP